MASGIDTSARFISLALNIAVMGFILVEGIASFLRRQLHRRSMPPSSARWPNS